MWRPVMGEVVWVEGTVDSGADRTGTMGYEEGVAVVNHSEQALLHTRFVPGSNTLSTYSFAAGSHPLKSRWNHSSRRTGRGDTNSLHTLKHPS